MMQPYKKRSAPFSFRVGLLLVFFWAPSANFTFLHAQLAQVFDADSTQQWWVTDRHRNIYYGWVRPLGQDSIVILQGDVGPKVLAVKNVRTVNAKSNAFLPIVPPKIKPEQHNYKGIVLHNAMPHRIGVSLRVHQIINPELEFRAPRGHLFAIGGPVYYFDGSEYSPFFYRYRYQHSVNERLHAAIGISGLRYRRSPFRRETSESVISSLFTYDLGYLKLTTGYLSYMQKGKLQGHTVPAMAQFMIPRSRFSFQCELYYIPNTVFFAFEPPNPWNVFYGVQYSGRILQVQLGRVPKNSTLEDKFDIFYSDYYLSVGFHLYQKK
jgi:hypothetical protein